MTSRDAILEKLQELMHELFDLEPERIKPDASFEDLELTSLDAIDLVIELQELTGRKVDEESLKRVRTVSDVVDLVQAQVQGAA